MSYQQTDPRDPLNRLRAYMDFYDQQGLGAYNSRASNSDPAGDRVRWAQQMLQQEGQNQGRQEPDYFDFGGQSGMPGGRGQIQQQQAAPQMVSPIGDFNALRAALPQNRLLMMKGGR